MKLYKDYTRESYSFLVSNTTVSSDYSLRFRKKLIIKRSISEKANAVNKKIEQKKAEYNSDFIFIIRECLSKQKVLISKDVLLGKELLERAGTIKIIKYSPLGKEMKKKQYQKLDNTYKYDRRKKKNKQLKI